jgi:hypothetical protein
VDSWLLSNFLNWGAIPAEARWLTEKISRARDPLLGPDAIRAWHRPRRPESFGMGSIIGSAAIQSRSTRWKMPIVVKMMPRAALPKGEVLDQPAPAPGSGMMTLVDEDEIRLRQLHCTAAHRPRVQG